MNTIIDNFKYKTNIIYHKRFRDDGFIIYNSECINEIHELFQIANSMHPLLKFTYSISKTERTYNDKAYTSPHLFGQFFNFRIFVQYFIHEVKKTSKF